MPFQKGHDPNRNYDGRPKGKGNKKLTKSEMEKLNQLLGKLSDEAVGLIVESMRNDELPMKERVGAAKYILTTKIQTDQIVDRRKHSKNADDNDEEEIKAPQAVVINFSDPDKKNESK